MMNLVEYHISERVAYITLNHPDKRNALSPELIAALQLAFETALNDTQTKVIVLKAHGDVFSAGADLTHLQKLQTNTFDDNVADTDALRRLLHTIYTSPKMVIAQVAGHAIAGGCGLVSVCDIVFAVPDTLFGYTEVKIGFIPALVSCFLIRKLGEARVKELLLSGELVSAQTALQYGLINFIVEKDTIETAVQHYAEKIAISTSAQSIAHTKALLNKVYDMSLEDGLQQAVQYNAHARSSDDCKRGIAAFLNKEKLTW